MIAKSGLTSESQAYRVLHRFLEGGLPGLADRREDNGNHKVTEAYEWVVWKMVAGSPQDYGH
jgi:hypothetical protein